jgi:hypothetical protein
MNRRLLSVTSAIAAAAALSGCGKLGALERPGPLFGKPTAARATPATDNPAAPAGRMETRDPRDRSMDPDPPRTLPIPGQASDAFEPAPQGVLPDPFNNPRR